MLQPEPTNENDMANSIELWETWKEQEQRNRLVLLFTITWVLLIVLDMRTRGFT
jgi:hypothetical protein